MSETTLLPLSIEPQELVYQDRNQKLYRIIALFDGFSKEYYVSDHGQRVRRQQTGVAESDYIGECCDEDHSRCS